MSLRLFNTRTRSVELFTPYQEGHVRIYVCGLTPSAQAHLGHARSFLFFDVLRRYLTSLGYRVTYVQNVTDIDDRSIAKAAELGVRWLDLINEHYASFTQAMRTLDVRESDIEPRATAYMSEILAMVEALIAAGHAYVATDAVYFRVASFARYGQFSGRNPEELLVGARVAQGEHKDDPLDFALWKFAKPGEPAWPSPWGDGRPGWHIECSAMSGSLLGLPFDIHGGGTDLIFPHHENEIAQTEALHPGLMANFWIHGGLLLFDGKKMSKSLGNFEPLTKLLARHDAQAIRLLFLQTGYRKPMNFTEDSLAGATAGIRRLLDSYDLLRTAAPTEADSGAPAAVKRVEDLRSRFFQALDDDINTSLALSVLFEVASEARSFSGTYGASQLAAFMHEGLELLGLSPLRRRKDGPKLAPDFLDRLKDALASLDDEGVPRLESDADAHVAIEAVLTARIAARKSKNFPLSDRLRATLAQVGILVKDDASGSSWSIAG